MIERISRDDVLGEAINNCMQTLYKYAKPKVTWEDFKKQNKDYSKLYTKWEAFREAEMQESATYEEWKQSHPDWVGKCRNEAIGPAPYEFYYLPKEILKEICDYYAHAYRLDTHKEFLDTIQTLKNYCKEPIVDKYIEGENGFPGHRGYDHPDNLEKQIRKIFDEEILPDIAKEYKKKVGLDSEIESAVSAAYSKMFQDKFFEFLDMAGNFFNLNRDLNTFNTSVYLGCSPHSNKETVINNWKIYRGKDITINDKDIETEFEDDYD